MFEESASGDRCDRPELHRALDHLRNGDILAVWKLDRLSRSLKDLLHILVGGRKPKLKRNQRTEIIEMVNTGAKSAAEAARLFGFHRSAISRLLAVENLSVK